MFLIYVYNYIQYSMPRLITTNMAINNGGGHGSVERRYDRFSEYCLQAQPDILVVQEVSSQPGRTALRGLAKALGHEHFFYTPIYPGQEDDQGVVVSSSLEITGCRSFEPETKSNGFQIADLDVGGRRLQLVNVHMEAHLLADLRRKRRLTCLMLEGLSAGTLQVLAGDFNAAPRFPSMKFLKQHYRSAHELVHGRDPYTYPTQLGEALLHDGDATRRQRFFMRLGAYLFQEAQNIRPSGLPNMTTDYVLVSESISVSDSRLTGHDEIELTHSDHRGLQVDFQI